MRAAAGVLALAAMLAACGGTEAPTVPAEPPPPASPTVVVTSATWGAAAPIADAGERPFGRCSPFSDSLCRQFNDAAAPVVAARAPGQALALWQRYEGDGYRLVSSRLAGEAWTEPMPVTPETRVQAQRLLVDPRGNAFATWLASSVQSVSFATAGGAWSQPQPLPEIFDPQLAMDDRGVVHLLFTRWRSGIYSSRIVPGSPPSEPVLLQAQGPTSQPFISQPRLALARGGVLTATWLRSLQSSVREEEWDEVWTSRMRPGQSWSAPAAIARLPRAVVLSPAMGATDEGALLAYRLVERGDGGLDRQRVVAQHETGASAWSAPEQVSEPVPPRPASRIADQPAIASDGRGGLMLAWIEQTYSASESSRYEVRARRFDAASGTWGAPQLVSAEAGYLHDRFRLQIAASPAGDVVLLWMELRRSTYLLHASVFVAGSGWSEPQTLRTADRISPPSVALDDAGNGYVLWTEPADDRTHVWSARLAATSVPAR